LEDLTSTIVGPLVAVEAWRAISSAWVRVLRTLVSIGAGLALLLVFGSVWLRIERPGAASPLPTLETGLAILLMVMTTVSWLLPPALLAGAFSGERARFGLLLLLICQISSREIVLGRLLGRLAGCTAFCLPAMPVVAFLAALCDLDFVDITLMLVLPLAVGFGAAGLCCALSVLSRKGRDALLAVYLFDAFVVLAPVLAGAYGTIMEQWLWVLNPYGAIGLLAMGGGRLNALLTIALWLLIGMVGVCLAVWRLRPSATHAMASEHSRKLGWRRKRIPRVINRPMLWKEIHIEQIGTVSRIARWLGIVLVAAYLVGHFWLGSNLILGRLSRPVVDMAWPGKMQTYAAFARVANPLMACLLELAIGVRAASTIAGERERRTWDLILASPLEGKAILFAKLVGSLYAVRFLFLAFVIGGIMPIAAGLIDSPFGIPAIDAAGSILSAATVCSFMVTFGIALSLASDSTGEAIAWTVVAWLIAQVVATISGTIAGVGTVLAFGSSALATPAPWTQMVFSVVSNAVYAGIFLVLAFLEWWRCRRRFEMLSGRIFCECGSAPIHPSRDHPKTRLFDGA
jgi:ABC-type transport system involved in multi-copper enzyme maturation permease subunit